MKNEIKDEWKEFFSSGGRGVMPFSLIAELAEGRIVNYGSLFAMFMEAKKCLDSNVLEEMGFNSNQRIPILKVADATYRIYDPFTGEDLGDYSYM